MILENKAVLFEMERKSTAFFIRKNLNDTKENKKFYVIIKVV